MTLLWLALSCGAKRAGPSPLFPEPLALRAEAEGLVLTNAGHAPLLLDAVELGPAVPPAALLPLRLEPGASVSWPVPASERALRGDLLWHLPGGPFERRSLSLLLPPLPPAPTPPEPPP